MSSEPFRTILQSFVEFANQFGVKPTFPVPATVVQRHPMQFQKLEAAQVELAVHGLRHVDYTQLTQPQIRMHYQKAVQIFINGGFHTTGFRFPFLRRNKTTLGFLSEAGFTWDSSDAIFWPMNGSDRIDPHRWKGYLRILNTYRAESIQDVPSLPRMEYGLVEIPVSIPDDDILFERLRLNPSKVNRIWQRMLDDVRDRGEMLVLQLHPERFPIFKGPLRGVLLKAKGVGDCWVASLGEIAQWWNERAAFSCKVKQIKRGQFSATFNCSAQGQPLISRIDAHGAIQWYPETRKTVIHSQKFPFVGIPSASSENLKKFLADEQIIFEITDDSERTNLYIDRKGSFGSKDKRDLINQINACAYPLIRFKRWPNSYRFCLAITGDIDGIDLWDYWGRFNGC